MKRIFMSIALCLMCATLFTACKSNEQKITEEYVKTKELPILVAGAALVNAEIITCEVTDFNKTPN